MSPPLPPGPEPDPDPPEPSGDTMIVKVKNTTNETLVFSLRQYADGNTTDASTEERVKLAYNEEHTFTCSLGSNLGVLMKKGSYSTSYPDISDSHYEWTVGSVMSNARWKINLSDQFTTYIPLTGGQLFSGVYDSTQNYATQV